MAKIGGYAAGEVQPIAGSFVFLRASFAASETSVSGLFSPYDLTGADARELTVHLDINGIQTDATAPNTTVRVKEKIDGANYRTLDSLVVAASDSPGVVVGPLKTHRDMQITFQLSATLAANRTVPYTIERMHY